MSQIPESANKGLEGIIACTSEISTIHDTTLLYRGYTIEDLAAHCGFEETVSLLWNAKLPTSAELAQFKQDLNKGLALPSELMPVLESISQNELPLDVQASHGDFVFRSARFESRRHFAERHS